MSNGMNSTQAYLSTYPTVSEETASANGSRLLGNANIKAEVERLQAETSKKLQVTKESLINDLLTIKDLCLTNPRVTHNSIKAIEVISKMLGYNAAEKQEVSLSGPIDISKLITFDSDEKEQLND
jgi:phage terminase small subunit